MDAAAAYFDAAQNILTQIRNTQLDAIRQAADICADTIAGGGLVHLFATGHSRIFVEEMFPRYGSFPGFHPIVELSLTNHTQVVGANGQRQAIFLERVEGLGQVILRNFTLQPPDSFIIFSNSGVNATVIDVALEAKRQGLPVIAVTSRAHSLAGTPGHSSGQRLLDVADVVIDNCCPIGDALVTLSGLETPVGPGSTIGGAAITNAIKVEVAQRLVARDAMPPVITSGSLVGGEESARLFDAAYDEYRSRLPRIYGGQQPTANS